NLDLKFVEVGDTPAATAAAVEQLIKTEGVFAFAGAFIAGSEKEVVGVMEQHDVPLIGPLTLYPPTENSATIPVFYVLAGIPDQVRVLVDFAVKQSAPKEPNIVI